MATVEITEQSFTEVVKNGIVLLDWWAAWCGPCRAFAPIYEKASEANPDIVFGKVDTDAQPRLAGAFAIRSIPTLMIFRDGIMLFGEPGMLPAAELDDLIAQARAVDMDEVRRQASEGAEGEAGQEEKVEREA